MYQLEDTQLRVCRKFTHITKTTSLQAGVRIILLQHILHDTCEFIRLIETTGAEIFAIVAKPHSVDAKALNQLIEAGHRVIEKPYAILEETTILDNILEEAVEASRLDHKKILILEVGGYFAMPLTRMPQSYTQYLAGVVEGTTFGHNRYAALMSRIAVPVFSVARSPIKNIEARYVGQSAAVAMDQVLRELGVSLSGRQGLVIGYGMIGKNVAEALKAQNLSVAIYDKQPLLRLNALSQGYRVESKDKLLAEADIIFSATARRALTMRDMMLCKDNVILASVGSKNTEFDIISLQAAAVKEIVLSENITKYLLSNGKNINVVKDGTAINFIVKSCPDEILDLIFAEMLVCARLLLQKKHQKKHQRYSGTILYTPSLFLNRISKEWLKHVA